MEQFSQLLVRFLYRDLIFVLSGTIVITTLFFETNFSQANCFLSALSPPAIAIIAGLCWVVGYVVQEAACLIGLVNTSLLGQSNPCCFIKFFYQIFVGTKYSGSNVAISNEDYEIFNSNAKPESAVNLERAIGMLTVSACFGPTLLVCAISLFIKNDFPLQGTTLKLFASYLLLSVIMLILARIKLLQMRAQVSGAINAIKIRGANQ